MKKISLLIALIMMMSVCVACVNGETVDIALILSEKNSFKNNNFHLEIWKGIEKYADEFDLKCEYYESENRHEDNYREIITDAIDKGAKTIVLAGYLFENIAFKLEAEYPEVKFINVDFIPNNGDTENYEEHVADNAYSLLYAEEEAGFLAGYAAVMEGYRKLGFFGGMSLPTILRFGYGYVQGAEYAARELELAEGSIEMKYVYVGGFLATPEVQARADSWYYQGTEIIFACGGAIGQSVMQAAKNAEKYVIGVDTDQSGDSETIVTSAIKMLADTVYDTLTQIGNDEFLGGVSNHVGTDDGGVGLTMETARFRQFTQAQYDEICQKLANDENGINSGILEDTVDISDIPLSCVNLIMESFR